MKQSEKFAMVNMISEAFVGLSITEIVEKSANGQSEHSILREGQKRLKEKQAKVYEGATRH